MQPSYTHLTDEELVRHCASDPGDLLREGELIRRVVSGEYSPDAEKLEAAEEKISELESQLEDLKIADGELIAAETRVEELETQVEDLQSKLATVREAVAETA